MKKTISVCFVVATILLAGTRQGSAALITFEGRDGGVGPGGARPNSDAAASSFDTAAGLLGTVNLIDLESAPLGNFAALAISPGVTATLSGTDSDGGIRTTPTYFGGTTPAILGYNTTAGGEQFLGVVPIFNIGTATLGFLFDDAIQAFGMYITGLGTANGNLFAIFDDGTSQQISIVGGSDGGVQFFGFTDAGKNIIAIDFELQNVSGTRDIFAVDDIRFVNARVVPEPTTLTLWSLGAVALFGLGWRRRKRVA